MFSLQCFYIVCLWPSLLSSCPHVLATALGTLPPPQSLVSVPVVSWSASPVFSTPSHPPVVSWRSDNPGSIPHADSTRSQPHGVTSTLSPQPGLTLSPAAETFPKRLVDKVRSGQFVEMKELLTDNMSLISQLEAVQGTSAAQMLGPNRPRLREVSSLATWCYCFLGYVAIRTTDPSTRDQLAYARLLIKEAQRHGGQGWLDYDRAFRQQVEGDASIRWNTLIPGLQAATILGQRSSQGSFCTLCRGMDHTRTQCALSCLEPSGTSPQQLSSRSRPRLNICLSWNRGTCVFPGQCSYRHVCATCQSQNHKAKDCSRTPETSIYKRNNTSRQPPPSSVPSSR